MKFTNAGRLPGRRLLRKMSIPVRLDKSSMIANIALVPAARVAILFEWQLSGFLLPYQPPIFQTGPAKLRRGDYYGPAHAKDAQLRAWHQQDGPKLDLPFLAAPHCGAALGAALVWGRGRAISGR